MHELLLHASVPAYRQKQVLNILAGIAAMQPQTFHERHLVYKPTRQANRVPTQVGGSQAVKSQGNTVQATMQGDLFFLHVVEDLAEEAESERGGDEGKASEDDAMDGIDGGETTDTGAGLEEKKTSSITTTAVSNGAEFKPTTSTTKRTLQIRDIPEAGNRRPVTSRFMADIPISGNVDAFMSAMEYKQISTHHLRGHRFAHNSISLLLFQSLMPSSDSTASPTLVALDPGSYILQASVRVVDGTKPDQMGCGVKELIALKEMLKGSVELEMAERMALDTRVR
ncbi:MAG: hypothetical protein LQ352_008321 [Teloschistes flavicans]|nr:MAG: hypothetical protein LQ352_008321 [Teloschistes flavicans]